MKVRAFAPSSTAGRKSSRRRGVCTRALFCGASSPGHGWSRGRRHSGKDPRKLARTGISASTRCRRPSEAGLQSLVEWHSSCHTKGFASADLIQTVADVIGHGCRIEDLADAVSVPAAEVIEGPDPH